MPLILVYRAVSEKKEQETPELTEKAREAVNEVEG